MNTSPKLKPLVWVASSKADLMRLPRRVIHTFGFALHVAQAGAAHPNAKPLQGFAGAAVLEIVEDFRGNTYRAVYTVRFPRAIFVLHVFQKKSKRGIATPKADVDLIRDRLKAARQMAEEMK